MDVRVVGASKRCGGIHSRGSVVAVGATLASWLLVTAGTSCRLTTTLTHCTDPGGCKLPLVCHQSTNLCVWPEDAGSDAGEGVEDAGGGRGSDAGPTTETDAGPTTNADAGPATEADAGPATEADAGPTTAVDAGTCAAGFKPVNGACVDVDECALSPSPCGVAASGCTNTQGGYRCACVEGFAAPPLGGTCADVNECATGTDTCDHDPMACTNTEGSFSCACPSGFEGNGRTSAGCLWASPELSSLAVSTGELAPGFKGSTLEYALTLPPHETRVSFTPAVTYSAHAVIMVEGVQVESGTASTVSSFGLVPELRRVLVRSADLSRQREYRVNVRRAAPTYIKPTAGTIRERFALSRDGTTLAVPVENPGDLGGRVHVYRRTGPTWAFEAEVKGDYTESGDNFGQTVALSADGSVLAVGAWGEDSIAKGVGGSQTDNSAPVSGAAYIFTRNGSTWSQKAFIKASNAEEDDRFGWQVVLSSAGDVLAVCAQGEDSGGSPEDNSWSYAGAVYLFSNSSGSWSQIQYLKEPSASSDKYFGQVMALSGDGSTLAVGGYTRSAGGYWGVYVFKDWYNPSIVEGAAEQQNQENFGSSVALNEYGTVLAVGAPTADQGQGAAYVFDRAGGVWTRRAYVKASNTEVKDAFGASVVLSSDGKTLAVGATGEASGAVGINGDQENNSLAGAGAAYVFKAGLTWSQHAYVKATTPGRGDQFGANMALSGDGAMLVVGAPSEASPATGINGSQEGADGPNSGAIYIY